MVGGGIVALLGQDAKKIVALSTLSQLGLITYSLAMCSELLTLNHLLVHAYFKRLLFMCVGVLIHSTFGTQESRIGSDISSPRASLCFAVVSVLSISGGFIFYFCSPIVTGCVSMHMPSSPILFFLVTLFIGVGFSGKWVIDRNLWPRLYISARSGSVGASIFSSSVPGDVAIHRFSSTLYGHVRRLLPFSILA